MYGVQNSKCYGVVIGLDAKVLKFRSNMRKYLLGRKCTILKNCSYLQIVKKSRIRAGLDGSKADHDRVVVLGKPLLSASHL